VSRDRRSLGRCGEEFAAAFLAGRGYRVLAVNYRKKFGELDIVADEGGEIVFVEVKTRSSARFGHPLESVTAAKRKRMVRAALAWLAENGQEDRHCRFDAIAVTVGPDGGFQAELVRNAFEAF